MKVALFGGAFDPPHIGHQRIAQEMIKHQIVDEVWFVPVYKHPWEDRLGKWQMMSYEHRKKMVELVLSPGTKLVEYKDVSFAYPTLTEFAKKYPEHQFSWIIGADNLPGFSDWKLVDKVLNEFEVYVYPRVGFSLKPLVTGMTALTDFPEVNISSTRFRKRLRAGVDVSDLVDEKVLEYIEENKLYR